MPITPSIWPGFHLHRMRRIISLRAPIPAFIEHIEGRLLFANFNVFSAIPSTGDSPSNNWNNPACWTFGIPPNLTHQVPDSTSAVFITNSQTAAIDSAVPPAAVVFVGQGTGDGTVNVLPGAALAVNAVSLGRDSYRNGLWYQTGGTITADFELGNEPGSRGEVVLKGGEIDAKAVRIGNGGIGNFTVAGGSLHADTLKIGIAGKGDYSYLNMVGGSVIAGDVNVGSAETGTAGLLKVAAKGNLHWGGKLIVSGAGSTLDIQDNGPDLTWDAAGATIALAIGARALAGTLEFELTPASAKSPAAIRKINLENGLLRLGENSSLVIDASKFNSVSTDKRQTYTLLTFGGYADAHHTFTHVEMRGLQGRTAAVNYGETSITLTIEPGTAAKGDVLVTDVGMVTDKLIEPTVNYTYAPKFMYDETEGLYKVWTSYNVLGTDGDHIGYKQYPSIEGLVHAPTRIAMNPSNDSSFFDGWDAADPTVYRDDAQTFHLAYSGNRWKSVIVDGSSYDLGATRIGTATSKDGGRTFHPDYHQGGFNTDSTGAGLQLDTHTFGALINVGADYVHPGDKGNNPPGGYGAGQPAVALGPGGRWYMIFTYGPIYQAVASKKELEIVISSPSPDFTNPTLVTKLTVRGPQNPMLTVTDDLVYDPGKHEFAIISQGSFGDENLNQANLEYFSDDWTYLRTENLSAANLGFRFYEGIGLLTNSQGQILFPNFYSLTAVTISPSGPVYGNLNYLTATGTLNTTGPTRATLNSTLQSRTRTKTQP